MPEQQPSSSQQQTTSSSGLQHHEPQLQEHQFHSQPDMYDEVEPKPTTTQTVLRTLSGAVAGAAGIVAGQPFDTVKVRLQTQSYGLERLYRGPMHCAIRTVQEEGVRALFKGMASPIVANAPINAILFPVEHYTNKVLSSEEWQKTLSIDGRNFLAGEWNLFEEAHIYMQQKVKPLF
eukprot:gb/GECG01015133.1/.p1 GENE.gb/GECG01015133.1/~~gb/GECG01015133.1/.p1  ORF type:complete len:177 (+),score=23.39 gb/GECG01015133.1/:1-531(+)